MVEVGPHRGGESEVLDRLAQVAHLAGGQSPAELGVVVRRVGVDELGEVLARGRVLARVVLRPCEGFAKVAGVGFGRDGVLEHLHGRRRVSPGQQTHAALVPVVDVACRGTDPVEIPCSFGVLRHAVLLFPGRHRLGDCARRTTYDADMSTSRPPAPPGLVLQPFRALRYLATDLASVTSPPYDVIDEADRARLEARSPHNVVRLILPRDPAAGSPADVTRYSSAAALLRSWTAEEVLTLDDGPALYVYEMTVDGQSSRGLLGAVGLARPEDGIVLPHENTMTGPVDDRLALLRATQTNLEPIFLVYAGGGDTASVIADAVAGAPLVDVTTEDGVRHRLWAISEPDDWARVAADLAPRRATIADGHHRYATYLRYQDERHAAGDGAGPWDHGLAFLVDASSSGPQVHPIHRVIPSLAPVEAVRRAAAGFRTTRFATLDEGAAALAAARSSGAAFLVVDGDGAVLLDRPDPTELDRAVPRDRSAAWRSLDVTVATEYLIRGLWGLADEEGVVDYAHDVRHAVDAATASGGTALLFNPTPVEAVAAVAAAGDRMPRKSTLFTPKPATGLVLRPLA